MAAPEQKMQHFWQISQRFGHLSEISREERKSRVIILIIMLLLCQQERRAVLAAEEKCRAFPLCSSSGGDLSLTQSLTLSLFSRIGGGSTAKQKERKGKPENNVRCKDLKGGGSGMKGTRVI